MYGVHLHIEERESYHGKGTGDAKTMGALDYSYMNTT
jgi:hypothetical protein